MRFILLLALVALGACSSSDKKQQDPVSLSDYDQEVDLSVEWRRQIGKGQGTSQGQFLPAVQDDKVWVADASGILQSLSLSSGSIQWQTDLKQSLSAGVVARDGLLFVATSDGELLALKQSNGEEVWRTDIESEVVALPVADGDHLAVQTVDGKLHLLNTQSGKVVWGYHSNLPNLSLRGTSRPVLTPDLIIAGFANGKVVAVDRRSGAVRWEARIGTPAGRSELERLVDVDGGLFWDDKIVYVVGYQGHVAALDVESGRELWKREASSYHGPFVGLGNVYFVADDDHIIAIDERSTNDVWAQTELARRQLTEPVRIEDYIAVADYQGYVHLIKQLDGSIVGRQQVVRAPISWVKTGSYGMKHPSRHFDLEEAIPTRLVVHNDTLLAFTKSGLLAVLSIER